jgi:sialate O-acetylesterase
MKNTKISITLLVVCTLFVQSLFAEIKLPAIVSSNMVLQRNTTVVLWGWADAKEKIKID